MGNCLDKTLSDDSADENIIEDDLNNNNINSENLNNTQSTVQQSRSNSNLSSSSNSSNGSSRRRHRHHRSHRHGNGSRSSRYIQIIESSLPVRSTSSLHNNNNNRQYSQSYVNSGYSSTSFSSSPLNLSNSLGSSSSQQVYYLTPNVQRTADQLTEEDQIKLLKRMALVQQLPSGSYDENKKNKEYVILIYIYIM